MNNRPLRIGVAGVGFGAAVHIPAFQSEGVEVVAVCTRRPERAEEAAQKFGIPNTFTDYDAMLAMDGLDAVSIVTPAGLHHEMVMKAVAAKKHIICEKPFALNGAEAKEMFDAAQASGLTAVIAHEFRYSSGRSAAKELIDQGYIGNLRFCLMKLLLGAPPANSNQQPRPVALGGGMLFALGSHYIDCLRDWFGEVESVSGELSNQAQGLPRDEVITSFNDDTFTFTLNFAKGGFAQMTASRAGLFPSASSVEIYGDAGTLSAPQSGPNPPAHGTLQGAKLGDAGRQDLEVPARLGPIVDERDERLPPFRLQVRDFLKGIESGTSPAPNFYDGWRNQQVLDAVRESAKTGQRVAIDLA
ncbi:MAG: Gfo/Idh/MocA family protein [Dehalococcoidia bacterium]